MHRTVHADVVAIDQPYVINRLGASQPEGMIFVLKSDLVPKICDLLLIPSLPDENSIPKDGKSQVIVAAVGASNELYFRIFDGSGKKKVDTNEKQLLKDSKDKDAVDKQFKDFKARLRDLWPPHVLTPTEKDMIICGVTSFVNYTLPPTYDNFKLRVGKRPRPLVLRMNVGDMLEIHFENWLQSITAPAVPQTPTQQLADLKPFQQKTRYAGIHVNGLELVSQEVRGPDDIKSDGSWVGKNPSGLLQPLSTATNGDPQSITYRLYARDTGTFLLTSGADTTVHQLNAGLFGAVNVQPQGAEWYRSQTTRCEMQAATLKESDLREQEQKLGDYQAPPKLVPEQSDAG